MLAELALFLLSWPLAPAPFKPHVADAVGLWSRGRRQRRFWTPHVVATRKVILSALATRRRFRTIAVLGSGPLFDVPVRELAQACDRLLLIDHAHLALPLLRHPAQRRWHDLSGADGLAFLQEVPDLDWVISVNLLSQLARVAEDPAGEIRAHLGALAALRAQVTLISDLSYEVIAPNGRCIERGDLWHGLCVPDTPHRWSWTVAPPGEEGPATRIHQVAGWPDWHAAGGFPFHLPFAREKSPGGPRSSAG